MNDQSKITVRMTDLRPLTGGAGAETEARLLPIAQRVELISKLRTVYIMHPKAKHILRALDQIRRYGNLGAVAGSPSRTLLITGPSGSGKTRLLKQWAAGFKPVATDEKTTLPVLYVDIPAQSSTRGLIEHCLGALGAFVRVGSRDSIASLTTRLIHFIKEREVEMIIFDELQHVEHGSRKKVPIVTADFFKSILNASLCPIVLAGIEEAAEIYDSNIQLRRRSNGRLTLPRFDWRKEVDRNTFRALLSMFEKNLPFQEASNLGDMDVTLRIYYLCEGLFGRAVDFLIEATEYALDTGATHLSRELLAEVVDEMGEDSETWVNPFRVTDEEMTDKAVDQSARNASRVTRLHRKERDPKPSDLLKK